MKALWLFGAALLPSPVFAAGFYVADCLAPVIAGVERPKGCPDRIVLQPYAVSQEVLLRHITGKMFKFSQACSGFPLRGEDILRDNARGGRNLIADGYYNGSAKILFEDGGFVHITVPPTHPAPGSITEGRRLVCDEADIRVQGESVIVACPYWDTSRYRLMKVPGANDEFVLLDDSRRLALDHPEGCAGRGDMQYVLSEEPML